MGALPVLAGREGQHTRQPTWRRDLRWGAPCGGEPLQWGAPVDSQGTFHLFLLSFLGRCLSLSV